MNHTLVAVVAITAAALASPAGAAPAEVGQPAPDFTLKDEAGTTRALSAYRGKVVVLEWTNPDCPFVQRHYADKTMQKTLAALAGKPVVWLAIDSTYSNTPDRSAAWKKQQGVVYPILQDPSGTVGHAYGAKTTPHMFVIDEKGIVRYAGAIDDDPHGRSAAATNYVRQAVEAVETGKTVPASTTAPYGCLVKYKGNS